MPKQVGKQVVGMGYWPKRSDRSAPKQRADRTSPKRPGGSRASLSPSARPSGSDRPRKADELPLLTRSVFGQDAAKTAGVIEEYTQYQEAKKEIEKAMEELKGELIEVARRHKVAGMRYGQYAVYYDGKKTRRTLSAKLLVENGVRAEVVERCYQESKSWEGLRVEKVEEREA